MNTPKILQLLSRQYPGSEIFRNREYDPTEILCETEPAGRHPDYSIAIAVIDSSIPHFHKKSTELYEVLSGPIWVWVNGTEHALPTGASITIRPNDIHYARGDAALVKVTSHPGWTREDQFPAPDTG